MFHERARTVQSASLFLDALCICSAFGAAILLRVYQGSIPLLRSLPSEPWSIEKMVRAEYATLLVVFLLAWLAYLKRSKLYVTSEGRRAASVLNIYVKSQIVSVLATGAVVFALKISVSRLLFAYFFAAAFLILLIKQTLSIALLDRLRGDDPRLRHALVIGSSRAAVWFAGVVGRASRVGYHLVGMLLKDETSESSAPGMPVVGTVAELDRVLAEHPVEEVFIVGAAREMAELAPVAQQLVERGRVVSLVSTLSSGVDGVRGRVTHFEGVPMISYGPMPQDEVRSGMTRAVDVVASTVGIILLAPLIGLVCLAIKIADRGPVLFGQERLGLRGRRFRLYKFRSMRVDAEQVLRSDPELYRRYRENDFKLPEAIDPRISRLGRLLRKTSLDELPQLWNVLKGEMTLVGPRPIVPDELEQYQPYADLLLSVRPGLTGHWQVSGRSDIQYPERAFLDLDYVGSNSVLDDLSIVARTVPAVLRRRGAH